MSAGRGLVHAVARRLRHRRLAAASTLAALAAATDGALAVEARHLETGRSLALNPDRPCKLASVVKIPLAVHVLACVAEGRFALRDLFPVEPRHVCPGSGVIAGRLRVPGVELSIDNLLWLSLVESDNTATDVLFDLVGGPEAVQESMRAQNLVGIRVDRSIREMISALYGIDIRPTDDPRTVLRKAPARPLEAVRAFSDDGLDTASPHAVVDLLAALWHGRLLTPEHGAYLFSVLRECATGDRRIRALVPAKAILAQKTGTLWKGINMVADVGILRLPGAGGHVALAVFLTGSHRSRREQEEVIAHTARIAFEALG